MLALSLALALGSGCSDDNGTPDKGVPDQYVTDTTVDAEPLPDGEVPDLPVVNPEAGPDLPVTPDLPPVEASVPDLPVIDMGPDGTGTVTNDKCSTPEVLTLVSGTVTKTGDTTNATNEFSTDVDCGETSFDGPQVYYKVSLTAAKTYKVTMTPTGWDGALYGFLAATSCAGTDIDTACTGHASDKIGSGAGETILLKPTANEDWIIAVDGWTSSASGPFTLQIEEVAAPTNDVCSSPKVLTFTGTSLTEAGDTTLALPEFGTNVDCGSYSMDGNQLYYKVPLTAGKTYKASLTPDSTWDGGLYAFVASTTCDYTAINTACTGYYADDYGNGKDEVVVVAPTTTEDWIFVVDSYYSSDAGSFTLTIEEVTQPVNSTCAAAEVVTFVSDKATITGDTTVAPNEYTTQIDCGGFTDYDGNQVYFKVTIPTGKALKMALTPKFSAYAIVFQAASCGTVASINTDCGSSGATGGKYGSVSSGTTGSAVFNPTAGGDYIIAVDASSASSFGSFTGDLELITPPSNTVCSAPTVLTLASGTVSTTSDTTLATNEFGTDIECGTGYSLDGPQLYFQVNLVATKSYTLTLTPDSGFDAALYAFPAATGCATGAAIETACASYGSDSATGGGVETVSISSVSTTADWIIGVDSYTSSEYGGFTLKIDEI